MSSALDTLLQSLTGLVRAATEYINLRLTPEDPHREQGSSNAHAEAQRRYRARLRDSSSVTSDITRDVTRDSVPLSLDLNKDQRNQESMRREGEYERGSDVTVTSPHPSQVTRAKRVAVRPPPSDAPWGTIVSWCEFYRVPTNERDVLEIWLDEQRNAKTAKRDPRAAWNRNAPRIRDEIARTLANRLRLNGVKPAPGMTLARANEERPAPYHQIWKPSRDGQ